MSYDAKKHHRRSIRLPGYDYAQAGWYFVTVCTHNHACLFGRVVGEDMQLNDAGCTVQTVWDQLPDHYQRVQTDLFVVMPNHIHGVIRLSPVGAGPRACPSFTNGQSTIGQRGMQQSETGQPRGVAPTDHRGVGTDGCDQGPTGRRALSLPDVVGRFKTLTTKRYIGGVRQCGWPAFAGRLWQRNYHEHIIRNERSLNQIRQYIADNPARWAHDPENPAANET